MAASHRAAATGTGTTSVTVTKPTGTVDGDLLFAQVYGLNSGGTAVSAATAPAGWTQIDTLQINAAIAYVRLTTFYKVASGEGASFTFTTTGYTNASAIVSAYAGNWGATPLDVHSAQANGSSTNVSAASVTVSQNNSLAIFSAAQAGVNAETPATGYTEPTNGAATNLYRQDLNHNLAVSSGATGTVTATIAAAAINEAFLAVFKEASGTVVAAPVLAGSGLMPAPTPTIVLAAPVLTGSGLLPTPTPTLRIVGVVLTGSGLLPAPSLALVSNPTVLATVMAGSGLLPVPTISAGIRLAAPVLTGSGLLPAGTPVLRLTAPALAGSGALLAGTPRLSLNAPVLIGSGLLPTPGLSLSPTISAPVLSGSGLLLPGAPALLMSAPAMSGSGALAAPTLLFSQVILAPVMQGSGRLPVPQLVILTPLPGWGVVRSAEPFGLSADASLHGAMMTDGQAFGLIVAVDPTGAINRGEPFALIVDASPQGKD